MHVIPIYGFRVRTIARERPDLIKVGHKEYFESILMAFEAVTGHKVHHRTEYEEGGKQFMFYEIRIEDDAEAIAFKLKYL